MKKILLSLFVGFVGIISFCSSAYLGNYSFTNIDVPANSSTGFSYSVASNRLNCFSVSSTSNFSCTFNGNSVSSTSNFACFQNDTVQVSCSNTSSSSRSVRRMIIFLNNLTGFCSSSPDCPTCPTCQTCTGYNFSVFDNGSRILNSSINTDINLFMQGSLIFTDLVSPDGDYVVESSCSTGNDCPVISGSNWSSIYINDILHEGSSIIDITIPEEISWDYSRFNDVFSVIVSGYNTDPAYIQSVIDVQNYQPTSDDFSKLVGLFGSYGGLLIACLFVIIVFYLIKKMFK